MWFTLTLLACSQDLPEVRLEVTVQHVDTTLADLKHGKRLVQEVLNCAECHGDDLTGGFVVNEFPVGRLVAPNLTTLSYTTADWVSALHHGVSADGRKLLLMPSDDYATLDQRDLASAIAWLQALEPTGEDLGPSELGPLGQVLVATEEWSYAADRIDHTAAIPQSTSEPRGAYLIRVASCLTCHGGGPGMSFGPGDTPSANITPHADGLAAWSEQDFLTAMTTGRRPDGKALDDSMSWRIFASWPEEDLRAVWGALQALPAQPDPS